MKKERKFMCELLYGRSSCLCGNALDDWLFEQTENCWESSEENKFLWNFATELARN